MGAFAPPVQEIWQKESPAKPMEACLLHLTYWITSNMTLLEVYQDVRLVQNILLRKVQSNAAISVKLVSHNVMLMAKYAST